MEIKITQKGQGANLLSKFTGVLFGIFLTSIIFLFSIKILEEIGLYIGLIITILLTIFGFYYTKKGSTLRMIIWGVSTTLIFGIILYIAGLIMITNLLKGF